MKIDRDKVQIHWHLLGHQAGASVGLKRRRVLGQHIFRALGAREQAENQHSGIR